MPDMNSLINEEKIILYLSQLNPAREDIEYVKNIVNSFSPTIDYDRILKFAAMNGIAPLLYQNLKKIEGVPESIMAQLEKHYHATIASNIKNLRETLNIINILKRQKIDAIPLKGSLASELIFDNPGLYFASDIDILVQPSQLDKAKIVLIDNGYSYDGKNEQYMLLHHYHLCFSSTNQKYFIELHWNLAKKYFSIPADSWWENISTTQFDGNNILCLSPERYLLYLIFRLFSHEFFSLKFFVLISELIIKNESQLDWNTFFALAKKWKMQRLTTFTLSVLHDLWQTPVPDYFLTKKIRGYKQKKEAVLDGLFSEKRKPHIRILFLDTPRDILKVLSGRLFPSQEELRRYYSIPDNSKKIFLYYALNPILLPFFILKKRAKSSHH
jgi:hypothetical protein